MAAVFEVPAALIERLKKLPAGSTIGIDGRGSAGKTELAKQISRIFGWRFYSLDCSFRGDGTSHRRDVALDAIKAMREGTETFVVEGSSLFDTMHRSEIDFHIYIEFYYTPTGSFQKSIESYIKAQQLPWSADVVLYVNQSDGSFRML